MAGRVNIGHTYTSNFSNTLHPGAGFAHSFSLLKKLQDLFQGTEVYPQIFTHSRTIPGSFVRRSHPSCISSVTHPFNSMLHGPTVHCLQKSPLQRRQAKAETQRGVEQDE